MRRAQEHVEPALPPALLDADQLATCAAEESFSTPAVTTQILMRTLSLGCHRAAAGGEPIPWPVETTGLIPQFCTAGHQKTGAVYPNR